MLSELLWTASVFAVGVLVVYGLVWWSYKAREDRSAKVGLLIVFGFLGAFLSLIGLAIAIGRDPTPWGVTFGGVGLGLLLPLWPRFRELLSRGGGFLPEDPLHMTGLALFFGVLGSLLAQNLASPAPDEVPESSVGAIVIQGVFFVGVALAGVGLGIGRSARQAVVRLRVARPTAAGVGAAVGVVVAGLAVSVAAGALQLAVDSGTSGAIDENLEAITGGQSPLIMAPVIGLTAGIGEELVFRGLLQPRYGILLTSLLFTAPHVQYGVSFVLLGVFALSLLLGWLARRFGTTHAIIAHALYNMVSVLLSSL